MRLDSAEAIEELARRRIQELVSKDPRPVLEVRP